MASIIFSGKKYWSVKLSLFTSFLIIFVTLISVDVIWAEVVGPGWFNFHSELLPPGESGQEESAAPAVSTSPEIITTEALSAATDPSPEIAELARALQYDPKLIYDYVHNHIDFVPYYGSLKGATLTLLDESGNDFDQASLMIALLRESEYSPQYVYGQMTIPGDQLANWLGVDQLLETIGATLGSGGYDGVFLNPDGTLKFERVWVKVNIDGIDYVFDPAFKSYEEISGVQLSTAINYNQADLIAAAEIGATVTSDSVQKLNDANIANKLTEYTNNLINDIRNNNPNNSLEEIIGGRKIIQTVLDQYPTELPFQTENEILWTEIPQDKTTTLRVTYGSINEVFNIPEIAGKRLTITYVPDGVGGWLAVLYLDAVWVDANSISQNAQCIITINHPHRTANYIDQTSAYTLKIGATYAIVSDFGGTSDSLISKRQKLLDEYISSGQQETSEKVLGETLNIMGLTWLKEVNFTDSLLSSLAETVVIPHHKVGVMAQEEGYYIDVQTAMSSYISRHNVDDDWMAHFSLDGLLGSSFEHGMLEQLMGSDNPGISTIKLFHISNQDQDSKIYFVDQNNFSAIAPNFISGGYSQDEVYEAIAGVDNNSIQSQIFRQGKTLIVPDNGQLQLGSAGWAGKGYISRTSNYIGMIIGGGYYGGYVSNPIPVTPPTINYDTYVNTYNAPSPSTIYTQVTAAPPPPVSKDPVDLASGSFLYNHVDLALGGSTPLGLTFSRSYNSNNSKQDANLGYGWNHNYDIRLSKTSHGDPGLGRRQPIDAAAMITALYVNLDLMKNKDDLEGWVIASLISKWAVDQLIDNAITVHLGHKNMEFIKLTDGTYASPPGVTTQLVDNGNDTYSLLDRFGARLEFNVDILNQKRISSWSDIDDNTLSFNYSSDKLDTIQDNFGRSLTLGYNTNNQLTSVSDFTGRIVSYDYDAGDLTSYTDPEQKTWSYGYDPTGNHRMTSLEKPVDSTTNITTATNTYDSLGRVMSQTVPRIGDDNIPYDVTYNFYFSGYRNIEEDPAGNQTIYYFDKKGRTVGFENALGHKKTQEYDGQNHVIKETDPRPGINHTTFNYDAYNNLERIINAKSEETVYTYNQPDYPENPVSLPILPVTSITDYLGNTVNYRYDSEFHLKLTQAYPSATEEVSTSVAYYPDGDPFDGFPQANTDGRGTISNFTYDVWGNPDEVWVGSHPEVNYDYNEIGWLTKVIDQENVGTVEQAHTFFGYDDRGLMTLKRDPLLKETSHQYYDDGSLWIKTDRIGNTTTYTYTPSGNLRTITYKVNGKEVGSAQYNYNNLDQITSIKNYDDKGALIYSTLYTDYDAAGRLKSVTDPHGLVVSYAYDEAGNLTEITYPSTDATVRKLIYHYDELNRLQHVDNWLGDRATYVYDAAGRLDKFINFNNTVTDYGYDNANRLTSLQNVEANEISNIASYNYPDLDGNGNRRQVDETVPILPEITFGSVSYSYNDVIRNRLNSAGGITFTYDDEGQLDTKDSTTYTFDHEHRLTGISGVEEIQYKYDAIGNRLERTVDGIVTRHIYDINGNLLAEADGNNDILRYYIHGKGLLAMVTPANTTYCYHFDGSGNTVAMTDSSQAVVNAYAYTPFGMIANANETLSLPQPFKFAGQVGIMAEPNGFYYMRARYYDPEVGRFISEDPIGFAGGDLNLYAYVGNNPIIFIDPSGLCAQGTNWKQVFHNTADASWVAAAGAFFLPADGPFGELLFLGIGTAATAIENTFFSDTPSLQNHSMELIKTATDIPGELSGPYAPFINKPKNMILDEAYKGIQQNIN